MAPLGRPRKLRDMTTFAAEIPNGDLKELRAIAESDGSSVGLLVRQAIAMFLARRRTIENVLRIHDAESTLDSTGRPVSGTRSLCDQNNPRGEGSCVFDPGHEGLHRDSSGKEWR
jgi:hypothetical protein